MTPPTSSTPKPETPSSDQVSDGVSAFLARVLDQLSITAWLPAVFLVGNAAVLLALQGEDRLNLAVAVQDLVDMRWGSIIILIFAVIIFAMLIQAFEFEGLRFWEGYLRSTRLRKWVERRIRAAQQDQEKLQRTCQELERVAFDGARRAGLNAPHVTAEQKVMWNAMEKVVYQRALDPGEEEVADAAALTLNWPSHADPVAMHGWDIAQLKLAEYPEPYRLLPTRLGNVMRAAEDDVSLEPGEDLEGFMIRHLDQLPATVVAEHAAYRRRLEMYCGLMFVLASLAVISIGCLWGHTEDLLWRVTTPLLYLAAVHVSYRAAIASALGFGQALREANRFIAAQDQAAPASS